MFSNFNFDLLNSPDFKEDSVREDLIMPILIKLGYSRSTEDAKILSHKGLRNPFYKIGSNKRQITEIPDYLLQTNGLSICVLDAKSPKEKCEDDGQVYGYAIHPEIRAKYFAMCNGREFVLWEKESSQNLLRFDLQEIDYYWGKLEKFLSPKNFNKPNSLSVEATTVSPALQPDFDYLNRPLPKEIPVKKQSTARHFGVHGYFTKQAWNIVSHYIKHFTQPGDLVLDPFVGSGVTSIESLMQARKTIGIDLNPLPVFIINSLCEPTDIAKLHEEFLKIKEKYENEENKIKEKPQEYLEKYKTEWQNLKNIKLDKTADVQTVAELFSSLQTAELAFLKHLIKKVKDKSIQNSLLLAFSSSLNKHNLTFHYTKSEGGGDSSAFRYYRYRLAPEPGYNPLMNIFEGKVKRIIKAKQEIKDNINQKTIQDLQVYKGDATDLNKVEDESVDYIYTDPPYGAKIAYLDLSAMWNAWLDLPVTEEDFEKEAIEGGSHNKTKHEYSDLIAKSISEMYRVLKFDRWMSFVFAHKDPHYWHIIVETAEKRDLSTQEQSSKQMGKLALKNDKILLL
jgi:16S rRNA G966 N2-methylase RsmD